MGLVSQLLPQSDCIDSRGQGLERRNVSGDGSVHWVRAELVATVLELFVEPGAAVAAGEVLLLLDSMKMEIPVQAPWAGAVRSVAVAPGEVVQAGDPLVAILVAQ